MAHAADSLQHTQHFRQRTVSELDTSTHRISVPAEGTRPWLRDVNVGVTRSSLPQAQSSSRTDRQ